MLRCVAVRQVGLDGSLCGWYERGHEERLDVFGHTIRALMVLCCVDFFDDGQAGQRLRTALM